MPRLCFAHGQLPPQHHTYRARAYLSRIVPSAAGAAVQATSLAFREMVHHYAKLFELMPLDIRIAFRFYLLAVPHRRKGFSYNLLVHVYAELRISARCLSLIAQMSHHHIGMHTSSVNASVDACLSEPEHSTRWAEKVSHAQLLLRTLVALRHRPSKTLATRVIQGLLWSTQTALAEQTVRVMLQAGVKLAQPLVDLVMMQHGHRMLDGVSRYVVSLSTSSRRRPCSAQPRGGPFLPYQHRGQEHCHCGMPTTVDHWHESSLKLSWCWHQQRQRRSRRACRFRFR